MNVVPHLIVPIYIALLNMVGPHLPTLRVASLLALLLSGFLAYRGKVRGDLSPVQKGYLLYFALNVLGLWALPGQAAQPLRVVPAAFLYGSLLIIAVVPALFGGRHFTEYFARRSTPPAVWETEIFKRINRNMSWMWGALFAASLVVSLIPDILSLSGNPVTALAFQLVLPGALLLGVGLPLNKKYPAYYQRQRGLQPLGLSESGADRRSVAPTEDKIPKEDVMSNRWKVVAVNGSPHMGGGNASLMTQMMAPALADQGIDFEEIFLAEKRIEFCIGCAVCIEKGKCWRQDDHADILEKLFHADGVILASPVYFGHVTAQMKAFVDRSLAYGHKPRGSWKPGLAISVSAGMGETRTAKYLANLLRIYGAFSVATFTAIAVGPGAFLGKELVEARAGDLARELAGAIKEKRRYPATENDLLFHLFMGDLIQREKDFMRDDYRHWRESGFFDNFESYIGQRFSKPNYDEELRSEWIKDLISKETARTKGAAVPKTDDRSDSRLTFTSCRELLKAMPLGFRKEAAGNLEAVFQFEISGEENFTAHLRISAGRCTYAEGSHDRPDVTIKSPAAVWLAVSKGEMNGQTAFLSGKYRAEGDLSLLMKLNNLFGP